MERADLGRITKEDVESVMGVALTAEKLRWVYERMYEGQWTVIEPGTDENRSITNETTSRAEGKTDARTTETAEDRIRKITRCAEEITGSGGGISLGEIRVREELSF